MLTEFSKAHQNKQSKSRRLRRRKQWMFLVGSLLVAICLLLLFKVQSFAQETIPYTNYLRQISNFRTDIRRAESCADFDTVATKLEGITGVTMPNGTVMGVQHEGADQAIRRSCNQSIADRYLSGLCPPDRCKPGEVPREPVEPLIEITINLPDFLANPNNLNLPPPSGNNGPSPFNDQPPNNNAPGNNGANDNNNNDVDNDGTPNIDDALPHDPTENRDTDGDGVGNNADPDDDNDGTPDNQDLFPFDPTEVTDTDGDGIGNNADPDDDNDGIPDLEDSAPFDATDGIDTDGDGVADNIDTDDDNDGTPDSQDSAPLDPRVSTDSGDGGGGSAPTGNNAPSGENSNDPSGEGLGSEQNNQPSNQPENQSTESETEDGTSATDEAAETEDPEETPFSKFLADLKERLDQIPRRTILIIGVVVLMVMLIVLTVAILFWPDKDESEEAEEPEKQAKPKTTAKQELAAGRKKVIEGDYRQAVRKLFLAVLITLHEHGVIKYDTTLTNHEIVRHAILRPSLIKPLMPIIATYERVWYGFEPLQTREYDHLVKQVEQLKTTSKDNIVAKPERITQPVENNEEGGESDEE